MRKDTEFYKLIKEICKDKGILMRDASFGWVTELSKEKKVRHIVGESLELNSASSYRIASDKFACFSVLMQNKIPTIQYHMIFNPETRSGYENNDMKKAIILFRQYGKKAILKANTLPVKIRAWFSISATPTGLTSSTALTAQPFPLPEIFINSQVLSLSKIHSKPFTLRIIIPYNIPALKAATA